MEAHWRRRVLGAFVMIVLVYSTRFEVVAWTNDIFQIASESSYFYYVFAVAGHVVAVVLVVLA